MLSKRFLLSSLTTLLSLNGHLISNETLQEDNAASINGHVPVRSREQDADKREQMRNSRAKHEDEQNAEQTEAQKALLRTSNKLASSESQFMLAPRQMTLPNYALASYVFPVNCHWLISIADGYRSVELEDGSHWEVAPGDTYTLRNWRREDSLVITPNYSWLSSYDYYITNKNTNTYVNANLFVGPLAFGPYSHWITEIDHFRGYIYLENQMVWCVNPQDSHIFKDWAPKDHVIFGLSDSWISPFDHILINVNMDNHIRVKQY